MLIPAMARIDGQIMDRIAGLRLIQQWGAGLEGVDLGAAAERQIAVANVPSAGTGNAESVAEWCVMAAIALSRRLPELEKNIRQGGAWGGPIGRGLRGRTAGILGLGRHRTGIGGEAQAIRNASRRSEAPRRTSTGGTPRSGMGRRRGRPSEPSSNAASTCSFVCH